jgi:hypothetical protein
MKAQFGFIGKEEIELAKEELISAYRFDDGSWMKKNIWFEKPHRGNYVKGYAYDDVEELTEEFDSWLDTFDSLESIETFIEEFDYSFSDDDLEKIKSIIESGKTAYILDSEIDDDKSFLIFDKLSDGQYIWKGTVEEAYNELNEWVEWDNMNNHVELIAIGVLK